MLIPTEAGPVRVCGEKECVVEVEVLRRREAEAMFWSGCAVGKPGIKQPNTNRVL